MHSMSFYVIIYHLINLILSVEWTPLSDWVGPKSAFYRSFDNVDCLFLIEGTELSNYTAIFPGIVRWFSV